MQIGRRDFDTAHHTYVMGILNITPDSFSDGGRYLELDDALRRAEEMISEGADLLDIGGESTRPGHTPVSCEEEMERVLPVIRKVREQFDVPISLDTSKAAVAEAGIEAGADLINDVWGLRRDARMAGVIAKSGLPCILMHNRMEAGYEDLMRDICGDLARSIEIATEAGIANEKIILDPGIGFGKTYEDNLELLRRFEELNMFGYPVLMACSRKSVIGNTLNLPTEERLEGTLVTTVLAVQKGAAFVRVHDVRENVRAIRMAEALWG